MSGEDTSDEAFRAFTVEALRKNPSAQFGPVLEEWRRSHGERIPLRDSLLDIFDDEQKRALEALRAAVARQRAEEQRTASRPAVMRTPSRAQERRLSPFPGLSFRQLVNPLAKQHYQLWTRFSLEACRYLLQERLSSGWDSWFDLGRRRLYGSVSADGFSIRRDWAGVFSRNSMRQTAWGRFEAFSNGTRIDVEIGGSPLGFLRYLILLPVLLPTFGRLVNILGSAIRGAGPIDLSPLRLEIEFDVVFVIVIVAVSLFNFWSSYDDPRFLMDTLVDILGAEVLDHDS